MGSTAAKKWMILPAENVCWAVSQIRHQEGLVSHYERLRPENLCRGQHLLSSGTFRPKLQPVGRWPRPEQSATELHASIGEILQCFRYKPRGLPRHFCKIAAILQACINEMLWSLQSASCYIMDRCFHHN